jgi:5-methylcytosine-specific restriction endonuclease McrA
MPMLPKRSCIEPGCSAVAAAGSSRCSVHTRAAQQASQRFYDDQRGTTVERGYDGDHRRLRVTCFERDGWRCVKCGWMPPGCFQAQGFGPDIIREQALEELRVAFAAGERHLHMDHVVPSTERGDLRLDLSNVQTLCSLCHARKTMAERRAPIAGGTGGRSEKLPIRRGDQRWPCARQSAHKNFLF